MKEFQAGNLLSACHEKSFSHVSNASKMPGKRSQGDEPAAVARFGRDGYWPVFPISLRNWKPSTAITVFPRMASGTTATPRTDEGPAISDTATACADQDIAISNAEHGLAMPTRSVASLVRVGHISNSVFVRDRRLPVSLSLVAVML